MKKSNRTTIRHSHSNIGNNQKYVEALRWIEDR
jgi:hypothetical protein